MAGLAIAGRHHFELQVAVYVLCLKTKFFVHIFAPSPVPFK
jgi:hypothetical protein